MFLRHLLPITTESGFYSNLVGQVPHFARRCAVSHVSVCAVRPDVLSCQIEYVPGVSHGNRMEIGFFDVAFSRLLQPPVWNLLISSSCRNGRFDSAALCCYI